MVPVPTEDLLVLLVEMVADFFSAPLLAGLVTFELRVVAAGAFRTVPEFVLVGELLTLRLPVTASCRVERVVFTSDPVFVLVLLFPTVADFLSALFLWVTVVLFLCVEDLTAERVPALSCPLVRALRTVEVLADLVLLFAPSL